jgi:Ca2+-dependent lipid-binding protein
MSRSTQSIQFNSIQFGRVKNCLNPEWIEPIYLQNLNDTHILVEVWDDNRGKEEDVLMGKTLVNIKEALEQPEITKDEELDGGGM